MESTAAIVPAISTPMHLSAAERPPAVFVSDNRLLHQGLALLLQSRGEFVLHGVAADIDAALHRVRATQPRLVILDLPPEDPGCLTIASTVRREIPMARIILMGLRAGQTGVSAVVQAEIDGFVTRNASLENLLGTVRVGRDSIASTPAPTRTPSRDRRGPANRSLAEHLRVPAGLTHHEHDVMGLLAEGLSNKAIATRLGISIHTVKSHVHSVLEKLALTNRVAVAAFMLSRQRRPSTRALRH